MTDPPQAGEGGAFEETYIDPEAEERRALVSLLIGGVGIGVARAGEAILHFPVARLLPVSDEPAMVVVALRRGSRGHGAIRRAGHAAIAVLASGRDPDWHRLAAGGEHLSAGAPGFVPWRGAFVVPEGSYGCLGARLLEVHPIGGDRDLMVLEVTDAERFGGAPMTSIPDGVGWLDLP